MQAPTDALMRMLAPLRAGDPLGLGVPRPPPPPDPDPFDPELDRAGYARSLYSDAERAQLDERIARDGHMTIAAVRAFVAENTTRNGGRGVDPEIVAHICAHTNYKVFMGEGQADIYTREELHNQYPFHEFAIQPEAIFAQQELGVFRTPVGNEYVLRDVGDTSVEFAAVGDLVRRACGGHTGPAPQPLRVVRTKVYVGGTRWSDFKMLHRFYRGGVRVAQAQLACEHACPSPRTLSLVDAVPDLSAAMGFGAAPAPEEPGAGRTPGGASADKAHQLAEDAYRMAGDASRMAEEAMRLAQDAVCMALLDPP
jgi:hypothetical protein